jgi:PAS domain S-box-containing protein
MQHDAPPGLEPLVLPTGSPLALQESPASNTMELQDYVENAPVGMHWVDAAGIIKWANRAELELLGYEPHEYIGNHISEFHADKGKIGDILRRLGANETLRSFEAPLICKDGSIKFVQISSNVYREGGEFIHTRCFTVDVTSQSGYQAALQASEKRYRNLIAGLKTPLYTTDHKGRITLYNEAAAQLWGREPEVGVEFWCGSYRIFHTDGSPMALSECPMAICLREQRAVTDKEILVQRPDGSFRHVQPNPQPIFDENGKLIGAVNMLLDITRMRETERELRESELKYRELNTSLEEIITAKTQHLEKKNEELRKSEERYHKMVDEVEDYAIILLNADGLILNWNKGAEKIKGYREEEILGKSFELFYLKEDREKGLPFKLRTEAVEKGKAVHEGWRQRKDGTAFWGSIVLTALHDDDRRVIGFSKVTRDLTKSKLADDKMKLYLQQLEFQNNELEQFSYVASHDMKEPLRKIHFYNNFIMENCQGALDQKSKDYLQKSQDAARRMKALIDNLLTYSRAVTRVEGNEQTDLNLMLTELGHHHEDLTLHLDPLPVVTGVPFQLRQLFENLFSNAVKYKHPDRTAVVKVSASIVERSSVLDELSLQKYHKITVADNGIGLPANAGDRIFEIFQRVNRNTTVSGSGIGLAICKKIVQSHSGFIEASGSENEGAHFDVFLPVI